MSSSSINSHSFSTACSNAVTESGGKGSEVAMQCIKIFAPCFANTEAASQPSPPLLPGPANMSIRFS